MFHSQWLASHPSLRLLGKHLYRWDGTPVDKAVHVLDCVGRPLTMENILVRMNEPCRPTALKKHLRFDPRTTRTSRDQWALAEWELPEYRGIAPAMKQVIDEAGGSINKTDLVNTMVSTYRTHRPSVLSYLHAPMFVVGEDDDSVRLWKENEPYEYPNVHLRDATGVFVLGADKLGLLLPVDGNMVRGSGRIVHWMAGKHLGLAVGGEAVFHHASGHALSLALKATTIGGIQMGSVRSLIENEDAQAGNRVLFVLDKEHGSVSTVLTRDAIPASSRMGPSGTAHRDIPPGWSVQTRQSSGMSPWRNRRSVESPGRHRSSNRPPGRFGSPTLPPGSQVQTFKVFPG